MPALGDNDGLLAWARGKLDNADATVLTRLRTASGDWLQRRLGRRLALAAAVTLYFDGTKARGRNREIIVIPKRHSPVDFSSLVVTENNNALTLAQGYSETADVIVQGADDFDAVCKLKRRPSEPLHILSDSPSYSGAWLDGTQNIKIVATMGTTSNIPADVIQVAYEIAWRIYEQPKKIGKSQSSRAGNSTTFDDVLSDFAKGVIDARVVH